jgi:hypothetical protein
VLSRRNKSHELAVFEKGSRPRAGRISCNYAMRSRSSAWLSE